MQGKITTTEWGNVPYRDGKPVMLDVNALRDAGYDLVVRNTSTYAYEGDNDDVRLVRTEVLIIKDGKPCGTAVLCDIVNIPLGMFALDDADGDVWTLHTIKA